MGWKNVKDHYNIVHTVQVNSKGICIGSMYIHDLMVISLKGELLKRAERGNADLQRYESEMDADPEKLVRLVLKPDVFFDSVTVYTYEYGLILTKQCEAPGWPNITHDGYLMFANTYSTDKAQVVQWAKQNARAGISLSQKNVQQILEDFAVSQKQLLEYEQALGRLVTDFPAVQIHPECSDQV